MVKTALHPIERDGFSQSHFL